MKQKIAIFCGGPSSEHEVSLSSASTIFKFLDKKKYQIVICYITKDLNAAIISDENLEFKKIKASTPLLEILNLLKKDNYLALLAGLHGEFVEDGKLQTILEYIGISYTGSNPQASSLAMDKYRSMLVAKHINGLSFPVTFFQEIDNYVLPKSLSFPIIIKPNELGSSVGVYIAKNQNDLKLILKNLKKTLGINKVLLQEYLDDALELSCGCLQKKDGSQVQLPPIEIRPKKSIMFDYASKYEVGGSEEITPPISISKNLSAKISRLSQELHALIGCSTYSRSDFMLVDEKVYYLETNTLPGMTATSLLPQEAAAIGITYTELLDFLIQNS